MDTTERAEPASADKKYLTVRQAAFIGVEPASIATLAGILVLSIGLDYGWKRGRTGPPSQIQVGGVGH